MSDETIDAVARSRIETHEEICAARYLDLQGTLKSLNDRMFLASGALIVSMLGIIVTLITRR